MRDIGVAPIRVALGRGGISPGIRLGRMSREVGSKSDWRAPGRTADPPPKGSAAWSQVNERPAYRLPPGRGPRACAGPAAWRSRCWPTVSSDAACAHCHRPEAASNGTLLMPTYPHHLLHQVSLAVRRPGARWERRRLYGVGGLPETQKPSRLQDRLDLMGPAASRPDSRFTSSIGKSMMKDRGPAPCRPRRISLGRLATAQISWTICAVASSTPGTHHRPDRPRARNGSGHRC